MTEKQLIKKITRQIQKQCDEAAEKTAQELSEKIEAAYEKSIDRFYSHYTPRIYDRTYSTYLASDGHKNPRKNYTKMSDGSYVVGITVGSDNIHAYGRTATKDKDWRPYKDDTEYVFHRTFFEGIHGIRPEGISGWAKKKREENQEDIVAHNAMLAAGLMTGTPRQLAPLPEPMFPPPKYYMDKEFKEITAHANIDRIFNSHFKKQK